MKQVITLILMSTIAITVSGQVVIIPIPHQEGYFTLDDIWQVSLISTQSQSVGAQLETTIEDAQHQLVLTAVSTVFNLLPGSNRPSFSALGAKIQYGSGNTIKVLRSTGRFPYGNYIICYRVMTVNNSAMLGEFCQEETVMPFSPPELISPYNSEIINTTMPVLMWKPPFPPGAIPIEYTLRLVEIKEHQDATEALESNAPLVSRNRIFNLFLPYPAEAPKLETGKSYAWQVSAKAGDFELGITEIWMFKINETKSKSLLDEVYKTYRDLKLSPDGSFNPIVQKLQFVFNNRWGAPSLNYEDTSPPEDLDLVYYKIYPAGKQASPVSLTSSTVLLTGVNRLTIDLVGVTGINDGENYIMVLREPSGRDYYLEFTYND